MKLLGLILLIAVNFFTTIFINVPIIQSIWNILIYPIYPYILNPRIVLFAFITISIIKYKKDKKRHFSKRTV